MAKKYFLILLLIFFSGIIAGCSKEVSVPLDILTSVQIEAGSAALAQENLFAPYEGQSVVFERELSSDELAAAGQSYEVPVLYQGQSVTVTVEIIDTTPPVLEGAEDLEITEGESLSYKKNIQVSDNSSQEVTLEIDNSQVDLNTPGTYPSEGDYGGYDAV